MGKLIVHSDVKPDIDCGGINNEQDMLFMWCTN